MKGNTPDVILKHFIVVFSDGRHVAPTVLGLESNIHGCSAQAHSGLKLKIKPYNTFTMIKCTVTTILL